MNLFPVLVQENRHVIHGKINEIPCVVRNKAAKTSPHDAVPGSGDISPLHLFLDAGSNLSLNTELLHGLK